MMRSAAAILFVSGWGRFLCGSPIVPVPTSTTTCAIAGQPVACGYNDGTTRTIANASATITGFGTNQIFINLDAYTEGGTYIWPAVGRPPSSLALASIELNFLASTDGPERQGLASYSLVADGDHGVEGSAYATSYVEGLDSCAYPACHNVGKLVPFTLGKGFNISLFARAGTGPQPHMIDGGEGYAYVRLSLFELSGAPASIYDPPADAAAVPEPSSAVLMLIGGLAISTVRFLVPRLPANARVAGKA